MQTVGNSAFNVDPKKLYQNHKLSLISLLTSCYIYFCDVSAQYSTHQYLNLLFQLDQPVSIVALIVDHKTLYQNQNLVSFHLSSPVIYSGF